MIVEAVRVFNKRPVAPGEYNLVEKGPGLGYSGMWFSCPCGCMDVGFIAFGKGDREAGVHAWEWDGNEVKPTLRPSLQKSSDCRWHGWLMEGKFIEV